MFQKLFLLAHIRVSLRHYMRYMNDVHFMHKYKVHSTTCNRTTKLVPIRQMVLMLTLFRVFSLFCVLSFFHVLFSLYKIVYNIVYI